MDQKMDQKDWEIKVEREYAYKLKMYLLIHTSCERTLNRMKEAKERRKKSLVWRRIPLR
jgi:hypothetical protein